MRKNRCVMRQSTKVDRLINANGFAARAMLITVSIVGVTLAASQNQGFTKFGESDFL